MRIIDIAIPSSDDKVEAPVARPPLTHPASNMFQSKRNLEEYTLEDDDDKTLAGDDEEVHAEANTSKDKDEFFEAHDDTTDVSRPT